MSGTWKDGAQKSVYGMQDDVRHTYEQVFFGRQLTDNNAADLPKPEPTAPTPPPAAETPDAFAGADATATHDHAEFYKGIWGETLPPEPEAGGIHGSPQLTAPTIDGTATPGAPQIEAPKIEPPSQGDDLTPGY